MVLSLLLLASQNAGVPKIAADAKAIQWMATAPLSREFLATASKLPHEAPRKMYRHAVTREWFSAADYAAANPSTKDQLQEQAADEDRYYQTKYGSPLTYLPMMEILGAAGIRSMKEIRILDFGYGMIGQPRMWSLAGAHAVGVDVDPFLHKLYSERSDQGRMSEGSVKLVHGFFPKEAQARALVGNGFDLIVSKNTLKLGYIHPRREAPKAQLIDLGVSDEEFVRELWQRLKPGGYVLIYNISPAQNPPDKPYIPWADGETAFARATWENRGFRILAFDENDDAKCRGLFRQLGYDEGANGKEDLSRTLFTHYTLAQKPNAKATR